VNWRQNGELAAKDGELAAKSALWTATEIQHVQVQARTQAMSASRVVLETARWQIAHKTIIGYRTLERLSHKGSPWCEWFLFPMAQLSTIDHNIGWLRHWCENGWCEGTSRDLV
jgi:hypothetical protein